MLGFALLNPTYSCAVINAGLSINSNRGSDDMKWNPDIKMRIAK